jgi:HAD superfamily hydrolase (TIGR01490 family)
MVHIFDVDHTVIRNTSAWYFLQEAVGTGLLRLSQIYTLPFELIRYKLGKPNMDFIETAVKKMAGIDKSDLERVAQACFEQRMRRNIYTGAAALVREAIGRGEQVIFATSSFDVIIRPLENFFGIKGSLASVLEFSGGKTTGSIAGNSLFGPEKKNAVEKWLKQCGHSPDSVCFYSDSYTDLPLLEFCGVPIAVNPDRFLTKKAQERGWEIKYFNKTVKK